MDCPTISHRKIKLLSRALIEIVIELRTDRANGISCCTNFGGGLSVNLQLMARRDRLREVRLQRIITACRSWTSSGLSLVHNAREIEETSARICPSGPIDAVHAGGTLVILTYARTHPRRYTQDRYT